LGRGTYRIGPAQFLPFISLLNGEYIAPAVNAKAVIILSEWQKVIGTELGVRRLIF